MEGSPFVLRGSHPSKDFMLQFLLIPLRLTSRQADQVESAWGYTMAGQKHP